MVKTVSLRKNYMFRFVYNKGKSTANKLLVMYILNNNTDCNRLGVCCSKKVGGSVVRSRVTRLIKESYRLHEKDVKTGLDIIVVARNSCSEATFSQIESAQLHLLTKHKLINTQQN